MLVTCERKLPVQLEPERCAFILLIVVLTYCGGFRKLRKAADGTMTLFALQ